MEMFVPPYTRQTAEKRRNEARENFKFYQKCYRVLSKKPRTLILQKIETLLYEAEVEFKYYDNWIRRDWI